MSTSNSAEYEWIKELWPVFFPKLELHPAEKLLVVINIFYKFFLSKQGRPLISSHGLPQKDFVYIDIPTLHQLMALPDFMDMLVSKPKDVIGCISIAVSLINHNVKLLLLLESTSNSNNGSTSSNNNSNNGQVISQSPSNINQNPFEIITSSSNQINSIQSNRVNNNISTTE